MKKKDISRKKCTRRSCLRARRLTAGHYILFLSVGFLAAFITFSITLYVNSDYLLDFIDYYFFSQPNRFIQYPIRSRLGEHYQAKDFLNKARSVDYDHHLEYSDFDFQNPKSLTYQNRTYADHTQILYRFPRRTPLAALLFIFHGCRDSAGNWFHTPERQRIIGAAIDLGYGCLVFQSTNRTSGCWMNEIDMYQNEDVHMVLQGLHEFFMDYPVLVSLPRFTFGSSSGGIFSSIFALNHKYGIHGQILFTSIILPQILYTYVKPNNYPPTVWIHMLRDIEFASEYRINASKNVFLKHNIPYNSFPIEPVALIHATFHERIPTVTIETSRFLLYQFQLNQWINSFNYLIYNPRRKLTWQTFLFPSSPPSNNERLFENLNNNRAIISQFLNTIYGEHAISFERSHEALAWLKKTYLTSTNKTDWST